MWAAVIAGAVGALVALPALRLSGIYLALATAAFAVVLDRWLFNLPNFNIGPIDVKLFELGTIPVAAAAHPVRRSVEREGGAGRDGGRVLRAARWSSWRSAAATSASGCWR